jgi:hypothetical protein
MGLLVKGEYNVFLSEMKFKITVFFLFAYMQCVECPVTLCQYFTSYSCGHSQSEMSYEHGSDSQRLRAYGYLKLRINESCNIENSKMQFFLSVCFAFIRNIFNATLSE